MILYNWEAEILNVNNFIKYGITFTWFLYKFWLRKNKTLEGYIKIHNPQPSTAPLPPKSKTKFKSYLQKF